MSKGGNFVRSVCYLVQFLCFGVYLEYNGGIFALKTSKQREYLVAHKIAANGTAACGTAHGVCAMNADRLLFTDTAKMAVVSLSICSGETKLVVGSSNIGKVSDGSGKSASFAQPTGICRELNSVFVVDTGSAQLKLITSTSPLKDTLSYLGVLLRAFGVNPSCEKREEHSIDEGILHLESMSMFLHTTVREAREYSSFRGQPCGPQGAMSSQTLSDLDRLLDALRDLKSVAIRINPDFLTKVDLHSLLTLLVENLFSEMRGGSTDTAQVLDFSRRFSSSSRELLKRLSKSSFNYYTSKNSYYSRPHCALSFEELPFMPKLTKTTLPKTAAVQMREWRQRNGQSVRQQSVRNMSTKDKPGTLPVNAYVDDSQPVEVFDFAVLQRSDPMPPTTRVEETHAAVESTILAKKGEFASVKHGYAPRNLISKQCPFFLVKLSENILQNDPVKKYSCLWFCEDLLPYHFVDSGTENGVVVSEGIIELGVSCVEVEDGLLRVEEELYEKAMLLALDEGDTTTATEKELISTEQEEELQSCDGNRKSKRGRKRVHDPDFLFT